MKGKERMSNKNNMTLRLEKMTQESICKSQISKKKSLQEKGITLIALVVTIIILLILAGVTLNMALSQDGLFSKTKEAADKYKQAQSDEEEMVRQIATQMYSEYVGAEVTGYTPTGISCEIETTTSGHTDTQNFERENLTWRIWDFDGTTLRIIGDTTDSQLYLYGVEGYNNGVWALDHICKELYSNDEHGITATTLKRSDIQKVSTYDYTEYMHKVGNWQEISEEPSETTVSYGQSVEYENELENIPGMWMKNDQYWVYEDNGVSIDKEGNKWETIGTDDGFDNSSTNLKIGEAKFKESRYAHKYNIGEFINTKYYNLIFENGNKKQYWIGTRFSTQKISGGSEKVPGFGITAINQSEIIISGSTITPQTRSIEGSIRPIVTINLKDNHCELNKEGEKYVLQFN